MAKTFDEILSEMITFLTASLGDTVDTRPGTVLREAILAPTADQLEEAFVRTEEVEKNQSISNASEMTTEAMDALAANFGLTRFSGSAASGTVRFYRFQIPSSPIFIPAGTVVTTSESISSLSFSTVSAITLDNTSDQDPVTGAYYEDVTVVSSQSGTIGNVAANTIRFHTVPGIDEVANISDLSGGKVEQTNEELAEAIIARSQGNLGTRGGYDSLVRQNFTVDDVAIISPTDSEAKRKQFAGAVDVVILSDSLIESEETVIESESSFVPIFRPMTEVTSVTGIEQGTLLEKTLVEGTDYTVYIDIDGSRSRSNQDASRIDFAVTSFIPDPGSVFTIRYKNSELVRIVQGFLDTEQYLVVGADPLVKLSDTVYADVTADVEIIPGYSSASVSTACENAVQAHFDGLLLDEDVQVSDIVTVLGSVDGVDSVDLGTFSLYNVRTEAQTDEILVGKDQNVALRDVTINVTG